MQNPLPLPVKVLQSIQHVLRVPADPDLVMVYVRDDPLLVYEVRYPGHGQPEPSGNAVQAGDFLVGIGEEGEWNVKTASKLTVALRGVGADAD